MKNKRNKIITFEEHLEKEYGNKNSPKRVKYEAFKLGVMLQELRKEKNLTQEQLADKCGTTKNYISRIENDASDIRLSTLMRILKEGFGGQLNFVLKFN